MDGPTENFEEMKVLKFQSLLRDFSCSLPSLKKASKNQAILGIILSIIFLLLGAGGNFLLAGLMSANGVSNAAPVYVSGAVLLVGGTLLLIYNILLLRSVRDNQGVRVFKIIKVGCLIDLYLGLFVEFLALLATGIFLADQRSSQVPVGGLIGGFLFVFLCILLTILIIYAIHRVKPKIVSVYIYIYITVSVILVVLGIVTSVFSQFFIIDVILLILCLDYTLKMFVLHLNMMAVTPVTNNHHHQLLNTS